MLKDIKYLLKHGVLQDDPIIKEEEEPEEVEYTKIDKVLQICQNLYEDMDNIKKIISRDNYTCGN